MKLYNPVEHNISLLDYLVNEDRLLNAEGSGAFGLGMLALYSVLVIAAVVLALFTMLPLSAVCIAGAIAQILLIYFLRIKAFMNPDSLADFPISLSVVCIILLVIAAAFTLAGIIVSLVVKEKATEENSEDWTYEGNSEERDIETGLLDSITLVQLNTGKSFEIPGHKETIIGRSKTSDIIISNPIMGRAHAKIVKEGEDFVIVDLNSRNGTYVGDNKLPSGGKAVLRDGEYITFGNEMFQVKVANNGSF